MSDRAYCQVIVYHCPTGQRSAMLAKIESLFDFGPWDENPSRETRTLVFGERYGSDEQPLDAFERYADELIEVAPGSSFACWSDPKYEYDGAIVLYEPTLGRYRGACGQSGDPYLTARQIEDIFAAGDVSLTMASGFAWLMKFEEALDG